MPQLSGTRIGQAGIEASRDQLSADRLSDIVESLRPASAHTTRVMKPKVTKPKVTKPKVSKPKVLKPKVSKARVLAPVVSKPAISRSALSTAVVPKPGVSKAGQRRRQSLPIVILRGLAVTSYRLSLMGALGFLVVVSTALIALTRDRSGH
jgi:hypothetical protein